LKGGAALVSLPRSGAVNLARRFNAGFAVHWQSRHVVTPELVARFNRRYATKRLLLSYPALKRRAKFTAPLRGSSSPIVADSKELLFAQSSNNYG
jgi:hypothetical protein